MNDFGGKFMGQDKSPISLDREYRRQSSRARRKRVGSDVVNYENRKSYYRKLNKLLAIQNGEIQDDGSLTKFIKGRMLRAAKWRAKRDHLEFDLTEEDIILPEVCPVSGIKLQLSKFGPDSRASYSLDRIDNTKGYVRGNVCVISKEVNAIKGAKTIEFFERLVAYMKGEL